MFRNGVKLFAPRYSGLKWVVAEGNKVSKCKGIINWKVLLSTYKFNPSLRIEKWGEDAAPWKKKHSDDFMQFHRRLSIWPRTMLAHWQLHKTKESSQLTKLCSFSNENCATAISTSSKKNDLHKPQPPNHPQKPCNWVKACLFSILLVSLFSRKIWSPRAMPP